MTIDHDDWIERAESREMLNDRLDECQEQLAKLQAMLGRFEDERISPTSERPYVISVTIWEGDYKRIFDMVSRTVPEGLDLLVSGRFDETERKDNGS